MPAVRTSPDLSDTTAIRVVGVSGEGVKRTLHAHPSLSYVNEILDAVSPGTSTDSVTRAADPRNVNQVIAFMGLGSTSSSPSPENLRLAAGSALRKLTGAETIDFALGIDDKDATAALVEGALLGSYTFTTYKGTPSADAPRPAPVRVSQIHVTTAATLKKSELVRLHDRANAVSLVKDLVNTPAMDLYPETFVTRVRASLKGLPVSISVWDENKLTAEGFGGIIGVGQGSIRPPRLMRLRYSPTGSKVHLALVGKGITFDTGGLSLKNPVGMVGMKYDMTGAATAAAVLRAIAQQGLPIRVTAWLALAENMPSGSAMRPNDVLTIRGGKTVEVLNTDAEGRLVMADALAAASEERPDLIIDLATLTGAATVALGTRHVGAMGSADEISRLVEVARECGENVWPMPIPDESRALLRSEIADIANAKPGNTAGGMLVAAAFLREFVGRTSGKIDAPQIPWIHLDLASAANNGASPYGFTGMGPTGTTTRSLISFAEVIARK